MGRQRARVATPGECQCKTGGVRRLAVANGPNIFSNVSCFNKVLARFNIMLQDLIGEVSQ